MKGTNLRADREDVGASEYQDSVPFDVSEIYKLLGILLSNFDCPEIQRLLGMTTLVGYLTRRYQIADIPFLVLGILQVICLSVQFQGEQEEFAAKTPLWKFSSSLLNDGSTASGIGCQVNGILLMSTLSGLKLNMGWPCISLTSVRTMAIRHLLDFMVN